MEYDSGILWGSVTAVQLSAEGMAKDIDLPYLMHPSELRK
jgi:hypothetical protein